MRRPRRRGIAEGWIAKVIASMLRGLSRRASQLNSWGDARWRRMSCEYTVDLGVSPRVQQRDVTAGNSAIALIQRDKRRQGYHVDCTAFRRPRVALAGEKAVELRPQVGGGVEDEGLRLDVEDEAQEEEDAPADLVDLQEGKIWAER
jgi:hypothetical protein